MNDTLPPQPYFNPLPPDAQFDRVCTLTAGGRQFQCPPFHVDFEQTQKVGIPSTTTVKIYNPSDATIKSMEAIPIPGTLARTYPQITIDAGYKKLHGLCIQGQIIDYKVTENPPDRVLEVKTSDNPNAWMNAWIGRTFLNQTASSVLAQMCLTAGITSVKINVGKDKVYPAISITAFLPFLNWICADTGSGYFFQGSMFVISPLKPNTTTIQLIDKTSGLISRPEKTARGYKFKTQFLFGLNVGSTVLLKAGKGANLVNATVSIFEGKKRFSMSQDAISEWEGYPA